LFFAHHHFLFYPSNSHLIFSVLFL
jgi:hypothetical protein